jgi:hypothetical protein
MTTTRSFPFVFSPAVRDLLGSAAALNDAVRTSFPALASGGADRSLLLFEDGTRGVGVALRPGARVSAGTVLGLFAGTVHVGSPPRGHAVLPLPAAPLGDPAVRLYVDGEARAFRHCSSVDAVLYMHTCDNPTVVGEWWHGGPLPCLLARAARDLRFPDELCWNFNDHGVLGFAVDLAEVRRRGLPDSRAARCTCAHPDPCPHGRFTILPAGLDLPDDGAW